MTADSLNKMAARKAGAAKIAALREALAAAEQAQVKAAEAVESCALSFAKTVQAESPAPQIKKHLSA